MISDHLPQFMIVPNFSCNTRSNKGNIFERDWSNFDQENFILDYFSFDWEAVGRRWSLKKVFLEISQNSQENACARVSF